MSKPRRAKHRQLHELRVAEAQARCHVIDACDAARTCEAPLAQVASRLGVSDRSVRRWRRAKIAAQQHSPQKREPRRAPRRGRPPRPATRDERNQVYRWLKQRGPSAPLAALRAEFPMLRVADLRSVLKRYRQFMRRKAQRYQSRLEWRRPGTVWAADFKERREPLEGRYGWILSIQDLGSRCQLAWEPLVEATAAVVQAIYARLFEEHGPPLVLKSDNGGQFKADATKELLGDYRVIPLYSPKRHPQYNGGVERANGQVASYQEAIAAHHARPAGPTCDDAEAARELANDLAHPRGWQGPTARELWEERLPITPAERQEFLVEVDCRRAAARDHWHFAPDELLDHYAGAAVDRRAVRETLVAQELLVIHPKRKRKRPRDAGVPVTVPTTMAHAAPAAEPVPLQLVGRRQGNPSMPRDVLADETGSEVSLRPERPGVFELTRSESSMPLPTPAAPGTVRIECASGERESTTARAPQAHGAVRIVEAPFAASSHDGARLPAVTAPPTVGEAPDPEPRRLVQPRLAKHLLTWVQNLFREGRFLRR